MPASGQLRQSALAHALGLGDSRHEGAAGSEGLSTATPSVRERICSGLGACFGFAQPDAQSARNRPSSSTLPGVPSAMTRPWSMTAMRSASWSASSRYCVVRSTVVPPEDMERTMSQTWLRLLGIEARGRLVEEEEVRRDDYRGRDVEPAPHAPRIGSLPDVPPPPR